MRIVISAIFEIAIADTACDFGIFETEISDAVFYICDQFLRANLGQFNFVTITPCARFHLALEAAIFDISIADVFSAFAPFFEIANPDMVLALEEAIFRQQL